MPILPMLKEPAFIMDPFHVKAVPTISISSKNHTGIEQKNSRAWFAFIWCRCFLVFYLSAGEPERTRTQRDLLQLRHVGWRVWRPSKRRLNRSILVRLGIVCFGQIQLLAAPGVLRLVSGTWTHSLCIKIQQQSHSATDFAFRLLLKSIGN